MKKKIKRFLGSIIREEIERYMKSHRFGFIGSAIEMFPMTHDEFERYIATQLNSPEEYLEEHPNGSYFSSSETVPKTESQSEQQIR